MPTLTEAQEAIGRRNFMKAAATLPVAAGFGAAALNAGPVRAAIVGTGMEGRVLLQAVDRKYIHIIGSCDIRPDNYEEGKFMITTSRQLNENPKKYDTYEQLLADPEVEAVLIATPLVLHGPMTLQALDAGKHVLTEKTMAYSVDECVQMVEKAKSLGLVLQVGHMKFYNPLYWDAYRMIKEGLLGNVYHARMAWHRNTDWNYWSHVQEKRFDALMEFDPTPHNYKDLEELVNWRWYNRTSQGMWSELASHQLAISNWFFGENGKDTQPVAVQAVQNHAKSVSDLEEIYASMEPEEREIKKNYEGDPRDSTDHIYAIYEYPNNRVVTYSAIQSNIYDKSYEMFMGTWGTVILQNETESYLYWEVGWDEGKAAKAAKARKEGTQVGIEKEGEDGHAAMGHATGGTAKGGGGDSGMTIYEPYTWELQGFAHTIRTGAPNLCDGARAGRTAQAIYAGKEAAEKQQRIVLPNIFDKYAV